MQNGVLVTEKLFKNGTVQKWNGSKTGTVQNPEQSKNATLQNWNDLKTRTVQKPEWYKNLNGSKTWTVQKSERPKSETLQKHSDDFSNGKSCKHEAIRKMIEVDQYIYIKKIDQETVEWLQRRIVYFVHHFTFKSYSEMVAFCGVLISRTTGFNCTFMNDSVYVTFGGMYLCLRFDRFCVQYLYGLIIIKFEWIGEQHRKIFYKNKRPKK